MLNQYNGSTANSNLVETAPDFAAALEAAGVAFVVPEAEAVAVAEPVMEAVAGTDEKTASEVKTAVNPVAFLQDSGGEGLLPVVKLTAAHWNRQPTCNRSKAAFRRRVMHT